MKTEYSGDDLGLKALLSTLKAHDREPSLRALGLIQDGFPEAMVAYLETVARTGTFVDLNRYFLEMPSALADFDDGDYLRSVLQGEGYAVNHVIAIGRDGSRESAILWGFKGKGEPPELLHWDIRAAELSLFGTFTYFFEYLYEDFAGNLFDQMPEEFSDDLEALLRKMGSWERDHCDITFEQWKSWYNSGLSFGDWEDEQDALDEQNESSN